MEKHRWWLLMMARREIVSSYYKKNYALSFLSSCSAAAQSAPSLIYFRFIARRAIWTDTMPPLSITFSYNICCYIALLLCLGTHSLVKGDAFSKNGQFFTKGLAISDAPSPGRWVINKSGDSISHINLYWTLQPTTCRQKSQYSCWCMTHSVDWSL